MLELGKKRGEKPAPQASGSCGVSVSQGRQLCFTLHTSFQCALDVWMSNLIQTGTCQGHSGVSDSVSMEPWDSQLLLLLFLVLLLFLTEGNFTQRSPCAMHWVMASHTSYLSRTALRETRKAHSWRHTTPTAGAQGTAPVLGQCSPQEAGLLVRFLWFPSPVVALLGEDRQWKPITHSACPQTTQP